MRRAFVLPFVALSLGCGEQPRRELPWPRFEARAMFPELTETRDAPRTAESAYERAIAAAQGKTVEPGKDLVEYQSIQLAGLYTGQIARRFGEWASASRKRATFAVHTPQGEAPDAWLYARAFAPDVHASYPSSELGLFLLEIDRSMVGLGATTAGPAPASSAQPLGSLLPPGVTSALRASLGGLRFRASLATFSGWRWVGRTSRGLEARFASVEGATTPAAPGAEATRDGPATLHFGMVTTTGDSGAYVAVVCLRAPTCAAARDIADMIDSLRAGASGASGATSAPADDEAAFTALSRRAGVSFSPLSASGDGLAAALELLATQVQGTATSAAAAAASVGVGAAAAAAVGSALGAPPPPPAPSASAADTPPAQP